MQLLAKVIDDGQLQRLTVAQLHHRLALTLKHRVVVVVGLLLLLLLLAALLLLLREYWAELAEKGNLREDSARHSERGQPRGQTLAEVGKAAGSQVETVLPRPEASCSHGRGDDVLSCRGGANHEGPHRGVRVHERTTCPVVLVGVRVSGELRVQFSVRAVVVGCITLSRDT